MYDPRMLPDAVERDSAARDRAGYVTLAAAAAGMALYFWLRRGVFVPITIGAAVEYVFISATAVSFVVLALFTCVALVLVHLLVRRVALRHHVQPPLWSGQDVHYLRPLWWFGVSALSLVNLVRPHYGVFAVLSYAIVDLRWWWSAAIVLWVAHRVDARWDFATRRWSARMRQSRAAPWVPEITLAVVASVWVVWGTPILRFYGATIGDEPKYVRYCENLYQGLGFEISQIKPMSELPGDFRPRLWHNVVLFASIVPGELRSLASDTVEYMRHPAHEFNRARHREGGFLDGKNGGLYQVHGPGVSLLMLPAYLIDRAFAEPEPGSPAQWPVHLYAVNAFFVAVYALWTVLIFRFLRDCGADTGVAVAVSLASTLPLPAAVLSLA